MTRLCMIYQGHGICEDCGHFKYLGHKALCVDCYDQLRGD